VMPKHLVEALLQADPKLAIKLYHHIGTYLAERYESIIHKLTPEILRFVKSMKRHTPQRSSSISNAQRMGFRVRGKSQSDPKATRKQQMAERQQHMAVELQSKLVKELHKDIENSMSQENSNVPLATSPRKWNTVAREKLAQRVTLELAPHLLKFDEFYEYDNKPASERPQSTNEQPTQPQGVQATNDPMSARDQKLKKRFNLESDQIILQEYDCSMVKKKISVPGKLSLTRNYACFYSKSFGYKIKKMVPFKSVTTVETKDTQITIRYNVSEKKLRVDFREEDTADEAEAFIKALWIFHTQSVALVGKTPSLAERGHSYDNESSGKTVRQTLNAAVLEQFAPSEVTKQRVELEKKILTDKDWEQLISGTKKAAYQKDEVVFSESDRSPRFFMISVGKCRIEKEIEGSYEMIGALVAPDVFGVSNFFMIDIDDDEEPLQFTADEEGATIVKMEGHYINVLISMDSEFGARFYKYLATVLVRKIASRERLVFQY